jgi:hypothetical protein
MSADQSADPTQGSGNVRAAIPDDLVVCLLRGGFVLTPNDVAH